MKDKMLSNLGQFTGSQVWYRHPLNKNITYTEGSEYVAANAGAYWLLDEIVTAQMIPAVRKEEFQTWKLTVDLKNKNAVLRCEDGDYNHVFSKNIKFTDFLLDSIELWFENNVIYLPSER